MTLASPVSAYEEQATLEFGPVGAVAVAGTDPRLGVGGEVVFGWGLSPAWSIGASTRYLWHQRETSRHLLVPALELTWQLDLVAWVPRIALGVGPAVAMGTSTAVDVDGYLRVGIDRLVDSGLLGFDLRTDVYGAGALPGAGRVELSLVFRWGFSFERF